MKKPKLEEKKGRYAGMDCRDGLQGWLKLKAVKTRMEKEVERE